jgi:hypothetical protein
MTCTSSLVLQVLNGPQQDPLAAEPSAVAGPLHASAPGAQAPPSPLLPPPAAAAGPTHHSRAMNGPLTSALARHHRRTTSNGGSSDGAGSPNLFPAQAPATPAGAAAAGTLSPQSTGASASAAAAAGGNDSAAGVQHLTVGRARSQVCYCVQPIHASYGAQTTMWCLASPHTVGGGCLWVSWHGDVGEPLCCHGDCTEHACCCCCCCCCCSRLQDAFDDEVMQAYQQIRAERQREEQQQAQQVRQRQAPLPQANGPTAAAAAAPPPDVSQLMADKMLAGWALLGDHCPL